MFKANLRRLHAPAALRKTGLDEAVRSAALGCGRWPARQLASVEAAAAAAAGRRAARRVVSPRTPRRTSLFRLGSESVGQWMNDSTLDPRAQALAPHRLQSRCVQAGIRGWCVHCGGRRVIAVLSESCRARVGTWSGGQGVL